MQTVRNPAVAGMFYPANPQELQSVVNDFLTSAQTTEPAPKAIVAPHAGYIYSGPIAASAYARVANAHDTITRVILLGPSHRVPLYGLAICHATEFVTPLGRLPVDQDAIQKILTLPQVKMMDEAHTHEHSLEVHLPFLQSVIDTFSLVPIVVGDATAQEVSEVIEALWGGPETLIVISSDLSHYHDYDTARRMDRETSNAIEKLDLTAIEYDHACGRIPVSGLLEAARHHGLHAKTIDLRNSGDTAGPRDQVVGYGAYIFFQPQ